MADQRVLVPRWVQLVMLPLAILGLWAVLQAAGRVLLLFIIGALVALPIAATLRETAVYLRDHTTLEPWGTRAPPFVEPPPLVEPPGG